LQEEEEMQQEVVLKQKEAEWNKKEEHALQHEEELKKKEEAWNKKEEEWNERMSAMQSAPAPVNVSGRGETPEELRLREMEVQRREEELSKKVR
jgi:hypothetical protein